MSYRHRLFFVSCRVTPETQYFLESLKREMLVEGVTPPELVRRVKLNRNTVYKILQGKVRYLKHSTMRELASAVGSSQLLLCASPYGGPAEANREFKLLVNRLSVSGNEDLHLALLVLQYVGYLTSKNRPGIATVYDSEKKTVAFGSDNRVRVSTRVNTKGRYEFVVDSDISDVCTCVTESPSMMYNTLNNYLDYYHELIS